MRLEVVPGRQMPDGENVSTEQFSLADREGHDWNCLGVYLLVCERPSAEIGVCISVDG